MDEWVMRCVGVAVLGMPEFMVGQMLKAHDPNRYSDGRGWSEWTDDVRFARKFTSAADALDFWRQVSTVRPLRPDGQPNRPLTCYHIEVVRVCQTEDHATVV
jgi:hypothetical protein